jgi:hypothetical protein
MDYKTYLPGYLQGITRVLISYPLDYLRIFKQTNTKINIYNEIKQFKIYKGVYLPLTIVPIDRAISFALYEHLKKEKYSPLYCSTFPVLLSSIYMTPINLINLNYIYFKNKSILSIIKTNVNKSIYTGNYIELLRNNLSGIIYLYNYNILSKYYNYPFINGSLSCCIMWTILYPLDTIKVKKMLFKDSYLNIIKNNSFRSFYNGISLVYLRTIPSAGFGMLIYEKTRQLLKL